MLIFYYEAGLLHCIGFVLGSIFCIATLTYVVFSNLRLWVWRLGLDS